MPGSAILRVVLREHRFHTGTVELNYAEGPDNGPPFVVLHGGAGSWRLSQGFVEALAPDWHVYAPDLRGHGKSGHVPGHYRLQDYVDDTAAFLAGVVGAPSILYGHSLGGEVVIMLAAQHPEVVRAVIDGDAPLSMENHPTEEKNHRAQNELWSALVGRPVTEIAAALKDTPVGLPGEKTPRRARDVLGEDSPWYALQAENLHCLDPDMLAAVLAVLAGPEGMLAGYDPETLLPRISAPVLLLQGDPNRGGLLRDDEVERGLRLLRHGSHVRLTGIGHELHSPPGQEEWVLEAITPFLESV